MDKDYMLGLASRGIDNLRKYLIENQKPDGSWHFCFDTGTSMDAYMIILMRHLNFDDEHYINELVYRITSRQEPSGAWKMFADEPGGNLSVTIECYYALLLSGHKQKNDPMLQRAKEFILSRGGPHQAGLLTKMVLAVTGQYSWEDLPAIPVELILLPEWFPVNLFDLVSYTRVHLAPITICAYHKYVHQLSGDPGLADLYPPSSEPGQRPKLPTKLIRAIEKGIKKLELPRSQVQKVAIEQWKQFMLTRLEEDGTLYCYLTTTWPMIFALLALGYDPQHPTITKAYAGLKAMACYTGRDFHQQETTSTVWDTALIAAALQTSGILYPHPTIIKAINYLLERQHYKSGDWQLHNPKGRPGGWGFSQTKTVEPDVDDTAYALRALHRLAVECWGIYAPSYKAGLEWLLSMQNNDGGWAAFEKNTNKKWPTLLPMPETFPILTDPSVVDLSGRALEFLGHYAGMTIERPEVQRCVEWLLQNQEDDGSWFGRWGIAYIYGTWAAVTGLTAVGVPATHPAVVRAVRWLLSIQNSDGGWGESCLSDTRGHYVSLAFSTPSQTAWAVDALIAAGLARDPAVTRGVQSLVAFLSQDNVAATNYPTGAGLPGGFYIHYQSYRYVWPLFTLAHYRKALGDPG